MVTVAQPEETTLGGGGATVSSARTMPNQTDLPIHKLNEELGQITVDPSEVALARYVSACFHTAATYRESSGIDEDMRRALRALRNEYDPELKCLVEGVDVYLGITNLKVRALVSWVHDILMNADEQPWTIKPTPDETLSEALQEAIVQRLAQEINSLGVTGDLTARARELKEQAKKYKHKAAKRATDAMTMKIKDQLLQGNWRDTFSAFVHDLAVYPSAIMKGPFLEKHTMLKWSGNAINTKSSFRKTVGRVDPFDFFPSPNSDTCQDGGYVIERMRIDADSLLGYKGAPGFDELNIRMSLKAYPSGHTCSMTTGKPEEKGTTVDSFIDTNTSSVDAEYEVLVFFGKIPVSMLQEKGLAMTYDPQKHCECEVWVLGEYVLKAVLNPHPLGHRPYYATSFQRIPGQFWGQSLPFLLRDVQRVANSAMRSMVRNMGYSSGPIVEVDSKRMSSEEKLDMLEPWRVYYTDGGDSMQPNTSPAIKFNVVPSIASELMKVQESFEKRADDISGIPAYVLGNPQVAGAGRTLGGLSMLMGNAAKGVKQVISNIDRFVIEPVITEYYTLEMLFGTDDNLKGDAQVIARGATGILQKELSRANSVEILQILTPYTQSGIVSPAAVKLLLRDIISSMGYENVDALIEDPDRKVELIAALKASGVDIEALQAKSRQAQLGAPGGRPPGGTPGNPTPNVKPPGDGTVVPQLNLPQEPKLDGRSTPDRGPDAQERIPQS